MKKFLKIFSPVFLVLAVLTGISILAWATTPTVTITKSSESRDNTVVYNYTFTTGISVVDTVVLYKSSATPFYVGYMSSRNVPDSTITLQLETTEATADSVRLTALFQVSYKDSPSTTATPSLAGDDWVTFYTFSNVNATSFNNRFIPLRYGVPYKFRVVLIENDTSKDATQTFTARLCFPKFASL